jgi:hypothetical protein
MSSPYDSALSNEKKKKLQQAHQMMAIKGGGGSGATATPKTFGMSQAPAHPTGQNIPEDDENNGTQMAIQTCDAGMSPLVEKFNASSQALQAARKPRQL